MAVYIIGDDVTLTLWVAAAGVVVAGLVVVGLVRMGAAYRRRRARRAGRGDCG